MIEAAIICLVLSVHDGDTLTAQCDDGVRKVRLTEIDAPELRQPYSRQSGTALRRLCLHAKALIVPAGLDRYGRTLARVHCKGIDANAAQVRNGMAWAFDRYLTDPMIKRAETDARAARLGLWRDKSPTSPWQYRSQSKAG